MLKKINMDKTREDHDQLQSFPRVSRKNYPRKQYNIQLITTFIENSLKYHEKT
jgi:hypothetical protein